MRTLKSQRFILSVLTLVVLGIIIYVSRNELRDAWVLLGQANLAILALLIPFQIMVYFAAGEMIFSYLRSRQLIRHISRAEQTRIALELNLVNHIFPSGGVSGISYTTWRLHKLGVGGAQSTFAQVVRHVVGFLAFVALLLVSVLFIALDGQINRYIAAASGALVLAIVGSTVLVVYVFSSERRMSKVSRGLAKFINKLVKIFTFGRRDSVISRDKVDDFFLGMHSDFTELRSNKRLLIRPFLWGLVYVLFDVLMFIVTFWALGQTVNPAILMVAYGVAGAAGLIAFTPGGAGVFELIMIFFLTIAGVSADTAIAGTVLTRAILLTGTIVFGYILYQHALIKYGKRNDDANL